MNIFFLSRNVWVCARWHLNSHCVKMILESAQLLSTAIWVYGGVGPLKLTHANHPCAIWARSGRANWIWLKMLAIALCKEYTYRYGRVHAVQQMIYDMKCPDLDDVPFFDPPQAMPDQYKDPDSVIAYRNYYAIGKKELHKTSKGKYTWKNRPIPPFIV